MKYYFLLLLIVIGGNGVGQVHIKKENNPATRNQIPIQIEDYTHRKFMWTEFTSDTIRIDLPLQFHFIKIGSQVYQIIEHNPTIELVQPVQIWQPRSIQLFTDTVSPPYFLQITPTNSKP